MKMQIKLDDGAKMPTRAHDDDAGLDIYSRDTQIVCAKESAVFQTGVHIDLPKDTAGILISKSGLNISYGITSTGLIDPGYSGEIVVKMFNHSGLDYKVSKGDKISQLVIVPVIRPELELVEEIIGGERGNNGFGSSGR